MPNASWYESVEENALEQGDILRDCRVLVPIEAGAAPRPEEAHDTADEEQADDAAETLSVEEAVRDVVVMTQSCDIENDKVEDLLVAEVIDWDAWVRAEAEAGRALNKKAQETWRKKLVRGEFPALSVLHAHPADPPMGWSVADFRKLYTIRKDILQEHAASLGERLRLVPPYREHLSQAFARYFMRVGLPHEARAFEGYGTVIVT